jgi:hypothetical protein
MLKKSIDVSYQIRFGSFDVSLSDAHSREYVSRSLCWSRRHRESLSQAEVPAECDGLARQFARAYIDLSSFRTALRKRVHAAR